jgi:hypothetical protein
LVKVVFFAEILLFSSILTLVPALYSWAEITLFSSMVMFFPAVYFVSVSTAEITLFSSMLTFAPAVYFVSVAEIVLSGEIWMFAPAL